jgi:uncharacterized protein (DUF2342 family)
MFKRKRLFAPAALVCVGLLGMTAARADDAQCYTLASLKGTYAIVTDYGDHIAQALAVRQPSVITASRAKTKFNARRQTYA